MANPFLLMAALYMALAVLAALNVALTSLGILPAYNGLVWLRTHFITLGMLTEVAFGMLPLLVAARTRRTRPRTRWDIWLTLNAGLVLLAVAIPLVNGTLTIAGGTLVFIAATLLLKQLVDLRTNEAGAPLLGTPEARKFYVAGLSYLLFGIFAGTGLFVGWDVALGMQAPRDVHVHANLWGFTSLLFAGLWIDLYPALTGKSLAWPRSLRWIFWLMTIGTLGLVLGPWFAAKPLSAAGLVLHFSSTLLLLANVIRPLWGERPAWTAGLSHMVIAYAWVLIPAVMGPLVIMAPPGFPANAVESVGPPIMIYGWLLQFGYGLFPYLFSRTFLPDRPARLGGNRLSLIGVNLGVILVMASVFQEPVRATLTAAAFLVFTISMIPIALELWSITRAGMAQIEQKQETVSHDNPRSLAK